LLPEDSYGRMKRILFVETLICDLRPRTVLDFGCGTGSQLTRPLAERFPQIEFVGVDTDLQTVDWASKTNNRSNLTFMTASLLDPSRHFDMIIASEVLEHVEEPASFLADLRDRLNEGGNLVITVPNGYGPFEIMALTEALLTLVGLLPVLRRLKSCLRRSPPVADRDLMTLAASPHINFFTRADMQRMLSGTGFSIDRFASRTVFCGFVLDLLVCGRGIAWNCRLADILPAWCASDWMFACSKARAMSLVAWKRGLWARWRRRISVKRWSTPIGTPADG
jgi:SAM-dependent methyltransferase